MPVESYLERNFCVTQKSYWSWQRKSSDFDVFSTDAAFWSYGPCFTPVTSKVQDTQGLVGKVACSTTTKSSFSLARNTEMLMDYRAFDMKLDVNARVFLSVKLHRVSLFVPRVTPDRLVELKREWS